MKNEINEFIDKLALELPFLRHVVVSYIDYWAPEDPPLIGLFGEIGSAIAKNIIFCSESSLINAFSIIENGMKNKEEFIGTAIATGMIEAMINASVDNPQIWAKMEKFMEPDSKRHAIAWLKFNS